MGFKDMRDNRFKRVLIILCTVTMAWILFIHNAAASEIVYRPTNPSFGGSPLNGSFLLGKASAQNSFEEEEKSALEDFKEQLSRRITSELCRRLVQDAFGEDGLESGVYTVGEFSIEVDAGSIDGIVVTIRDSATGGETIIEVPKY